MSLVQTCFGFSSSISADIYREQVVRFRPVESKVMHLWGIGESGRGGAESSNFEKIYEVYLQGDTIFKREISYLCSW